MQTCARTLSRGPLRLALAALAAAALAGIPATSAGAAPACQAWNGTPPPPPVAADTGGVSIGVVSACDVWVAEQTEFTTYLAHWTGSGTWTQTGTTESGTVSLVGIGAASASNVWAVGWGRPEGTDDPAQPLIQHWDGTSWQIQPGTNVPTIGQLSAVSAASGSDAWAVGWQMQGNTGIFLPLTEHWDGSQWTVVPVPAEAQGALLAVSVLPDGTAWAVGSSLDDSGDPHQLALVWNGSEWKPLSVPESSTLQDQLLSVTALSPGNVWAAGYSADSDNTHREALIEHWDGQQWTAARLPVSDPVAPITGLAAMSATDIWAVDSGDIEGSSPHVFQYDGTSWHERAIPGFVGSPWDSAAISASPDGDVWLEALPNVFGNQINVAVLDGQVGVPNVNELTPAAAATALQAAELTQGPSTSTTACGPSDDGKVAFATPAAGTNVSPGSSVSLAICHLSTTVPNVLGFSDANARSAISGAGLTVGTVSMTANCTEPRGGVLTQSPQGGTPSIVSASVTLTESTGRQPNGKPCIFN